MSEETTSVHSVSSNVLLELSEATLFDTDGECPQCGDSLGPLWWMNCCGLIMCDTCRDAHDAKHGFRVRTNIDNTGDRIAWFKKHRCEVQEEQE